MNHVWIQLSRLNQVLDLCDCDLGRCGHHGVKVSCGLAIDEISPFVALPCFDKREVTFNCAFHYVWPSVELAGLFTFSDNRTVACGRVERGNTCATGANALGKRSLRDKI